MATFTLEEILTLDAAQLHGAPPSNSEFRFSVSTDSRTIVSDSDLYLALAGENFDGHNFVAKAFENGACLALVNQDKLSAVLGTLPAACASTLTVVAVPNTLAAYQGLARLHLRRVNPKVIAITGSSGKTTTKEMTAATVSSKRLHKSSANENNEIGVPKTILAMDEATEVLILEMGMRGMGQIAELAACAQPDVAVITCAGTAHIELLGSQENIARAKCELVAALDQERGLAVLGHATDLLVQAARAVYQGRIECCPALEIVKVDHSGTTFITSESKVEFFVSAHGTFLIEDAWCALKAAKAVGLSDQEAAEGLAKFKPVEGRGNALVSSHGAVVVDESYNANPDSVRCAVEAILSRAYPQSDKIVVLGAMAELGDFTEQLHRELGSWLKDKPLSLLITVGDVAALIADGARAAGGRFEIKAVANQEDALAALQERLGINTCVMVKGSHSTNLDRLVQKIL